MKLLTYLHDPDNLFVPLIRATEFPNEINKAVVAISNATTTQVKNEVISAGFRIIEGGLYGEARINAVKCGVQENSEDFFLLCDFDKLLHWLHTNPHELLTLLNTKPKADYTSVARSARALNTYPETWLETENIATKLLTKFTKQKLDFMNGPCILSNRAAKVISTEAKEQGVGSCVEFPFLIHQVGMELGNLEVDGLTWEDPDRYTELIDKAKTFDDWKYDTFSSLYEWRKRVEFLNTQLQVLIRLSEEPLNPKYPLVHNKTFEEKNATTK